MDEAVDPQDVALTNGIRAAGVPESPELTALVDESAILSTEQQEHVSRLYGSDHWGVDAATQTFTFTAPSGSTLVCRAHLLGSAAPSVGSWLWGWVNSNGFPDAFFERSAQARDAADPATAELRTGELPLTDGLPLRLTIAAKSLTGLPVHYSAPVGGGTRIWMLIDHPALALPAPTVARTLGAITATLDTVQLEDHRAAVRSWAKQRGVVVRTADVDDEGGDGLLLAVSDGDVTVRFDDLGRIARMAAEMEGDAGPEPAPPAPTAPSKPRGFLSRLRGRD
jgi:hypothetical protein